LKIRTEPKRLSWRRNENSVFIQELNLVECLFPNDRVCPEVANRPKTTLATMDSISRNTSTDPSLGSGGAHQEAKSDAPT
jgi:hypothetical protein